MKTFKKTMAVLLSIVMLLTLVPLGSFAEGEETISLWETKEVNIITAWAWVYLKFVPEETANYIFESHTGESDPYGYLCNSEKSAIARDDDGGEGVNFKLTQQLQAGVTYYWAVYNRRDVGSVSVSLIREHDCIDVNQDYYCDLCSKLLPHECVDVDNNYYCDICSKLLPHECVDVDNDYHCDICSAIIPHDCIDEDSDDICDLCGEDIFWTVLTLDENGSAEAEAIIQNGGDWAWFKFIPEEAGICVFESCIDGDTAGYLFAADRETQLAYNEDRDEDRNFRITYELEADTVYFFVARFEDNYDTGSIPVSLRMLHICVDENDDGICDICDKALWITISVAEPTVGVIENVVDWAWFKFVPEATGVYVFESTFEENEGTYCYLHAADRETELDYSLSYDENGNFRITHHLEANTVYFFAAKFDYGRTGSIPVLLTMDHACIDENNDYHCDICEEFMPHECVDTDGNFICDICCLPITHTCADENSDYLCDLCSTPFGHDCEFDFVDDVATCSICGITHDSPLSLNAPVLIKKLHQKTFTPEKSGTYIFTGRSAKKGTSLFIIDSNDYFVVDGYSQYSDFRVEIELEAGMTYYLTTNMQSDQGDTLYTVTVRCGHSSKTAYEAEEATCTALAHSAYEVCDTCGERFGFVESGEFAAHNFVDGVCTECNEAEPEEPVIPDEPTIPDEPPVNPDDPTNPEEPTTNPEEPTDPDAPACKHLCHKGGFVGFFWKIIRFFWKLFRIHPYCECGAAHY